jgi:hypothetical protein
MSCKILGILVIREEERFLFGKSRMKFLFG